VGLTLRQITRRQLSLIDSFRDLDQRTKDILADRDSPLQLGLAVLTLAHDRAEKEYLSLEHMVAALEAAGVAVKRIQLGKALARAGSRVSRKEINGETYYKVMTRGRREVERVLEAGNLGLLYIEGGKPRTSRRALGEILRDLRGTVRVCDPYYGVRSLEALELIPAICTVRFLTAKTNENPARLSGPIRDFKRERPKTELRIYPKAGALHDRYILNGNKILIIGHGLKDIGEKESFVISIDRSLSPDLLDQVEAAFDNKWAQGQAV